MAAEICSLFLPEVVWLDDVGGVDVVAEVVLQHLQDGLDSAPAGVPSHVYHDAVAKLSHIITEIEEISICELGKSRGIVFFLGNSKHRQPKISFLIQ